MGFQNAVVPLWDHRCMCLHEAHGTVVEHPKGSGEKNSVPRCGGGHGRRKEQLSEKGRGVWPRKSRQAGLSALATRYRIMVVPISHEAADLSPCCSGHLALLRLSMHSLRPSACPEGRRGYTAGLSPQQLWRFTPHPLPRRPRQLLTAFPAPSRGICFTLRLTRRGASRWRDLPLPSLLPPRGLESRQWWRERHRLLATLPATLLATGQHLLPLDQSARGTSGHPPPRAAGTRRSCHRRHRRHHLLHRHHLLQEQQRSRQRGPDGEQPPSGAEARWVSAVELPLLFQGQQPWGCPRGFAGGICPNGFSRWLLVRSKFCICELSPLLHGGRGQRAEREACCSPCSAAGCGQRCLLFCRTLACSIEGHFNHSSFYSQSWTLKSNHSCSFIAC